MPWSIGPMTLTPWLRIAVAHREQVGVAVDAEREVLQRAGRARAGRRSRHGCGRSRSGSGRRRAAARSRSSRSRSCAGRRAGRPARRACRRARRAGSPRTSEKNAMCFLMSAGHEGEVMDSVRLLASSALLLRRAASARRLSTAYFSRNYARAASLARGRDDGGGARALRLRPRGHEPAEGRLRRPDRARSSSSACASGRRRATSKTVILFSHPIGGGVVPAAGDRARARRAARRLLQPALPRERHRAHPGEVPARPRRLHRGSEEALRLREGRARRLVGRRLAVALLPGPGRAPDDHRDAGGRCGRPRRAPACSRPTASCCSPRTSAARSR